jgi:hypothetical protein
MRLPARFAGPPGSANGGIACGRLAGYVGATVVEVTLRRPPPLDVDLRIDASRGSARMYNGELLVAEAVPSTVDLQPAAPVTVEQAAGTVYAGELAHPFPGCFVCGTDRKASAGMGLRPGPVGDGRVATVWTPVDEDPVLVWAALDCPGGWSADLPGRPMVLGRMALESFGQVTPGAPHVVVGWTTGTDGRKSFTGTALYDAAGVLLSLARSTWLAPPPG